MSNLAGEFVRMLDARGKPAVQAAKAVTDISSHVARTDNPHSVTSDQVGALTPTAHTGTDHTGITGCGGLDVTAHAAIDHTGITGCGGSGGVTSIKKTSGTALTGDVILAAGSNVTLTQDDGTKTITIASSGGSSDGVSVTLKAHQAITAGQNVILESDGEVNKSTSSGRRLGVALDTVSAGADVRVMVLGKAKVLMDASGWTPGDIITYGTGVAGSCVVNNSAAAGAIIGTMLNICPDLASAKTYTKSIAPHTNYPDTNDAELTDGTIPSSAYTDSGWVGWSELLAALEIVIDLGEAKTFADAGVYFLSDGNVGIGAAETVAVSESDSDAGPWTSLGSASPTNVSGWADVTGLNGTKRYVKLTITRRSNYTWLFIGELRIRSSSSVDAYCLVNPR